MTASRPNVAAWTGRTDSRARGAESLVDVATVASYLGVTRGYVYEHASELGARRLGNGPRARLRFSLAEIDERLNACSADRRSDVPNPRQEAAFRPRRRRRMGTEPDLLPIRGRMTAQREAA